MRSADPAGNWDLPPTVRAVAAVLGRARALELLGMVTSRAVPPTRRRSRSHGSSVEGCLYVPKILDPRKPSRLVDFLGQEDAEKMVRAFPGEILWFSDGPGSLSNRRHRNEAMRRLREQGASNRYIAVMFGVTDRTVRNVFRGIRPGANRLEGAPR